MISNRNYERIFIMNASNAKILCSSLQPGSEGTSFITTLMFIYLNVWYLLTYTHESWENKLLIWFNGEMKSVHFMLYKDFFKYQALVLNIIFSIYEIFLYRTSRWFQSLLCYMCLALMRPCICHIQSSWEILLGVVANRVPY